MSVLVNKIINKRYTIVFVLLLSFPILMRITGMGGETRNFREKKPLKSPSLITDKGLLDGLKKYKIYFDKTFPLRQELLSQRNYFYVKYLGISPVKKVMLGKKNWLFLKRMNNSGSSIDVSATIEKFKSSELEAWFDLFSRRQKYLRDRGIYLFIVIVPNKSTIYPEFLSESVKKITRGVRADQFADFFRRHSDIHVINLREALQNEKKKRLLYHRTDTHWNFFGAWIGYREIIKHLSNIFPGVEIAGYDNFPKRAMKGAWRGDLASMLTLPKLLYREQFERIFNPQGFKIDKLKLEGFDRPKIRTSYFRYLNGKLPKTIVVHDSFGNKLRRFMSVTFSEIIFIWDWGFNFFPGLIEKEKPSIVIYEIAERFLYRPVSVLPES